MIHQETQNLLESEEDLRGKVLLPYLRALGFGPDQVQLEAGFSIRLGKNRHRVGASFPDDLVKRGRADCVVRSVLGRSLFLVEVKADGHVQPEARIPHRRLPGAGDRVLRARRGR